MDVDKSKMAKIKREHVRIFLRSGDMTHVDYDFKACDMAIPTPDGHMFLVRDLSLSEKVVRECFIPIDLIERIEVEVEAYWLKADGERGEKVLDTPKGEGHLITEEK